VISVRWRRGIIVSTIDICYGPARSSLRCRGSKPLAEAIRTAAERTRTRAAA
jgi:hypothetical protein